MIDSIGDSCPILLIHYMHYFGFRYTTAQDAFTLERKKCRTILRLEKDIRQKDGVGFYQTRLTGWVDGCGGLPGVGREASVRWVIPSNESWGVFHGNVATRAIYIRTFIQTVIQLTWKDHKRPS